MLRELAGSMPTISRPCVPPEHARPRPGETNSPRVLARSDSAGATHAFATACRQEGVGSPSGSPWTSGSRTSSTSSPGSAGTRPSRPTD